MSARPGRAGLARSESFLAEFLRYWLPVLAYVTLIFSLSSVANLAPPATWTNADKLVHVGEYTVLGFVLARAYYGSRVFDSLLACLLLSAISGFATGMFDELYQAKVPGRVSSHIDFLADALGVVVGQFLFALWSKRRG